MIISGGWRLKAFVFSFRYAGTRGSMRSEKQKDLLPYTELTAEQEHFLQTASGGMKSQDLTARSLLDSPRNFAYVLAGLVLAFSCGGYLLYQSVKTGIYADKYNELEAIGELKAAGLSNWRQERINTAAAISINPANDSLVRPFLENTASAQTAVELRDWLDSLLKSYNYDGVGLVAPGGQVRLFAGTGKPVFSPFALAAAKDAQRALKPALSTINKTGDYDLPHMNLYAPLLGRPVPGVGRKYLGVLIFRIDPEKFLFPYIHAWPVPSRSAETLLAGREGDNVVFLNKLRHSSAPPLSLRFPVSRTDIPAVQAVLGQTGAFEGRDYRGVKVLADLRPVPGTPWFIVSKVDSVEILSDLRLYGWTILLFVILSVAVTVGLIVIMHNIRQRKLYQALAMVNSARQESENKYRRSFDLSVFGKSLTSPGGGLVDVNKAFCEMLGYTKDEFARISFKEITHPDDVAESVECVRCLLAGERETYRMEKRYIHKDGRVLWTDVGTMLVRDTNGAPLHFNTQVIDITERKRAERILRDEKERVITILDLVGDPIFVKDNDHRITLANNAFYDIFSLDKSKSSVIGKTLVEAVPENERQAFLKVDRAVIDTGGTDQREEVLTVKGLTRTIITRKTRFIDQSGDKFLVGSIHDITESKRAEAVIQKTSSELAERNMEMERFLYTASHDLKTPAVTIRTFLTYLEKDIADTKPAQVAKDILFLRAAADKMSTLLDDLLMFSRIGRVVAPAVCVTLQTLAEEALAAAAGKIEQRGVRTQVTGEKITLCGDRLRLAEIWQNLVENACKYMGGQKEPLIEIGVEARGVELVFFVRDNGMGIDPRYQTKIFGLFEKLDGKSEGTGIGLALVLRIVGLYAGRIWVESAGEGQGSCFYFTLPAAVSQPAKGERT